MYFWHTCVPKVHVPPSPRPPSCLALGALSCPCPRWAQAINLLPSSPPSLCTISGHERFSRNIAVALRRWRMPYCLAALPVSLSLRLFIRRTSRSAFGLRAHRVFGWLCPLACPGKLYRPRSSSADDPPPQLSDGRRHRSAGAIRCRPALSAGDHSGRLGICCHRLCAGRCRLCLPVSRVLRRSFRSIPQKPNTIGISLRDSRRGSVPPLQQSSCTNRLYGAAAFAFCSRAGARPKRELPK